MRNYPKYTPKPKVRAKKESFCLKEGATSSILELVRQEGNRKEEHQGLVQSRFRMICEGCADFKCF